MTWNLNLYLTAFPFSPNFPIVKMLRIFVALCALGTMHGCSGDKINSNDKEPSALVTAQVDSMFRQFDHYSVNQPDSAILFAAAMEGKLVALNQGQKLINLYTLLSELYQYRKNDDSKAMYYMANALDVAGSLPDLFYSNPYFYVNIGNILFRYEMYAEAIKTYTEASRIAIITENPYATALAFNNIALCHQKQNHCDTARHYFILALSHITDKYDMMVGQHYIYLSSLALQCGNIDSIPVYADKAMLIFRHFEAETKQKPGDNAEKKLKVLEEDKLAYYQTVGTYYLRKHRMAESSKHFNMALDLAKKGRDHYLVADVFLNLAELNIQNQVAAIATQYADSAANHVKYNIDLKSMMMQKRLLAALYGRLHKQAISAAYQKQANELSDSLNAVNTREEVTRSKIKLTQARLDLVIQQSALAQKRHLETITAQKQFIWLMAAVLIVIATTLAGLGYFYRKLKQTQHRLALCTIETIENENTEIHLLKTTTKHNTPDYKIKELQQYFTDEKPHLDSNLKLNSLAERLKTNQTYLSQLINQYYGVNFNEFVNGERIKEACRIIQQPNTKTMVTIDQLFSMVGFSSKSAFYTAFQKYTGLTPAAYVKLHRKSIAAHYQ